MSTRITGQAGEKIAEEYLKEHGYKIIGRNFSCRHGEIDLIAKDGEELVFVEVKYRQSENFGKAQEAVNFKKLQKLIRTAQYYLVVHNKISENYRIDMVAINRKPNFEIELIKNINL